VRFDPEELDRPLRWKKPRTILVSLMGDWLDPGVSDGHAQSILDCARLFRRHTFLTVTKRAARLPVLLAEERPLPNILHGVSVCDQADADERLPHLFTLKAQGWRVWAIAEPLLGPIVLAPNLTHRVAHDDGGTLRVSEQCPSLDWLVVGKENHAGARLCDPVWIKSIVRQCREAKVPCFVKGGLPEADPDFVQQRPEETPA
jgi:protein gp37